MSSVFTYLILLTIGGILSYKGLIHQNLIKIAGKMQLLFLYILIFIMGLRIGLDSDILKAIYSIGFKALIYAVVSIFFSGLLVYLVSKFIIKSHIKGSETHDS